MQDLNKITKVNRKHCLSIKTYGSTGVLQKKTEIIIELFAIHFDAVYTNAISITGIEISGFDTAKSLK